MSGTSIGASGVSARVTSGPPPRGAKPSQPPTTARSAARAASVPTDSGIKGGTAQAPPKPSGSPSRGSVEGISGRPMAVQNGSVPSPALAGTQTSGLDAVQTGRPVSGPVGGGGHDSVRPTGPNTATSPVGPVVGQGKVPPGGRDIRGGEMPMESSGPRGGRVGGGEARGVTGARQAGRPPVAAGGFAGGTAKPGAGAQGKQAFTEGGSGLGARNRLGGEAGSASTNGLTPGVPLSGAQGRQKDREKAGNRPDYLVEDEETWASDKPANPNVVK